MKLFYEEPEINIRKYDFPSNVLFTISEPDLGDGDDYGDLPGITGRSVFGN